MARLPEYVQGTIGGVPVPFRDVQTELGLRKQLWAQVMDLLSDANRELGIISGTIIVGSLVTISGEVTISGGVEANLYVDGYPVDETNPVPVAETQERVTDPTIYNVALTLANTEYSQALPQNCRYFEFQCRTENDIRYAFDSGRVAAPTAPYMTLRGGDFYYSYLVDPALATPFTLYFGSATAGVVVEILTWT